MIFVQARQSLSDDFNKKKQVNKQTNKQKVNVGMCWDITISFKLGMLTDLNWTVWYHIQ